MKIQNPMEIQIPQGEEIWTQRCRERRGRCGEGQRLRAQGGKKEKGKCAKLKIQNRRAFAMMTAMICLFVVCMLGFSVLQSLIDRSRAQRVRSWQVQSEWLAESAFDRAIARRQLDAGYRGEVWRVSAEEIGGQWEGQVDIEIEAGEIRVTARFPLHGSPAVRTSRTMKVARQE